MLGRTLAAWPEATPTNWGGPFCPGAAPLGQARPCHPLGSRNQPFCTSSHDPGGGGGGGLFPPRVPWGLESCHHRFVWRDPSRPPPDIPSIPCIPGQPCCPTRVNRSGVQVTGPLGKGPGAWRGSTPGAVPGPTPLRDPPRCLQSPWCQQRVLPLWAPHPGPSRDPGQTPAPIDAPRAAGTRSSLCGAGPHPPARNTSDVYKLFVMILQPGPAGRKELLRPAALGEPRPAPGPRHGVGGLAPVPRALSASPRPHWCLWCQERPPRHPLPWRPPPLLVHPPGPTGSPG